MGKHNYETARKFCSPDRPEDGVPAILNKPALAASLLTDRPAEGARIPW